MHPHTHKFGAGGSGKRRLSAKCFPGGIEIVMASEFGQPTKLEPLRPLASEKPSVFSRTHSKSRENI